MYAQRKEGKETKLRLFRDGRRSCSQFTRADRSVHTVAHKDKILPRFQNTSQNPKTLPRIQNTSQNPKTLPRIENTSQNPKTLPRIENTSQNPKTHPGIQKDFPEFWDVFWILGSVFGFWKVFCPYEQPSVNGTQNSGLVNFVRNRVISSIFQKRPRRPEPGFKDGFEDMEHEFQFGIFRPEKT